MRHGINVLLLLIDLLISRVPIVTYHFQVSIDWISKLSNCWSWCR